MEEKKMDSSLRKILFKRVGIFLFSLPILHFFSVQAFAGRIEVSAGGNFGRADYGDGSYSWTRRLGGSLGYRLSSWTQVEVGYQTVYDRTFIRGYQDTIFKDHIYSADWTQTLLRVGMLEPYAKVGAAQLNRDASGAYASGATPVSRMDSLSGLLGAGLRIHLAQNFGIRGEVNSYLQGARISTWKQNTGATFGLSLFF